MNSRPVVALAAALACTALAAAWPASAQMYKWVDEKGQVTYSNTPPPDSSKKKVESVSERVSVYTPDAEINKAIAGEAKRDAKIADLERQLESERSARRTPNGANPDVAARRQAAYERCVSERRVDCDSIRTGAPGNTTYGYTGFYPPQYVIGARPQPAQPFYVDPTPPPRVGINNAPPAGISTAPKVGIDDRPPVGAPPRSRTTGQFR